MDPVSIIGLIASVVGIADVVSKSVARLSKLRARYLNAPIILSALIGQLCTIRAALDQLSLWAGDDLSRNPRYVQLASQVEGSLDCFAPLITALHHHLDQVEESTMGQQMSFVWNENDISNYLSLLDRQVNALTLLLQAIQCKTWADQIAVVSRVDSQTALSLAQSCTTSLIGLAGDRSSISGSILSEASNNLSQRFNFDGQLLASTAYQAAHRSHLKRLLITDRARDQVRHKDDHTMDITFSRINDMVDLPFETYSNNEVATDQIRIEKEFEIHESNVDEKVMVQGQGRAPLSGKFSLSHMLFGRMLRRSEQQTQLSSATATIPLYDIMEDQIDQTHVNVRPKLLLLGASGGGKSTLLESVRFAYGKPLVRNHQILRRSTIFSNLVSSTRDILEAMVDMNITLDVVLENHARTIFEQLVEIPGTPLAPEVRSAVVALWADQEFLKAFHLRREYELGYSAKYYADAITRLADPAYMPTEQDILRCWAPTSGIWEDEVVADGVEWHIVDVGGSRADRKKWIHVFDDTSVVVFIVDACSYNRGLFEDNLTNRMQEQLILFSSLINSAKLANTQFILVFNKVDELAQQLQSAPITPYFIDCESQCDTVAGHISLKKYQTYLENRFLDLIPNDTRRANLRVEWLSLVADARGLRYPAELLMNIANQLRSGNTAVRSQEKISTAPDMVRPRTREKIVQQRALKAR